MGVFRDGKFEGVNENELKYVGEYKNGTMHGQGTIIQLDVFEFVGEIKNGTMNGQGTLTYGSSSQWAGSKYVGEFRDGKEHGQGTFTFADGRVKEGIWENGELKQ